MARKKRKGHKRTGGHVPLPILEKRLKKLAKVVDDRGGKVPSGYIG